MFRCVFPLLLLAFSSSLAAPNVLLFTVDSCRADRFGAYGYDQRTTPVIDAWARSGTLFRNAFSTSAWTAPGLVSILTGLYPPTHGINNRDRQGSDRLLTLQRLFRQNGYRAPNLNFFTFAPYYTNLGLGRIEREYFGRGQNPLLQWLEKNASTRQVKDQDQAPFFLWFHTILAHQPYDPGPERLPAPREELEKTPAFSAVLNGAIVPRGSVEFEPSHAEVLNQLYDAEIQRVDELFGRVLEFLKQNDLLSDTLIVFTADHGEELLDHGFVGHASTSLQAQLYQECIRIPMILSWPGHVPSGQERTVPVSQVDVAPTILRLAGIAPPRWMQGQDLFMASADRPLFFESVIAGNQTSRSRQQEWVRAVLSGDYKFITGGELYNLRRDPVEQVNLYETESERAAFLRDRLNAWLEKSLRLGQELFPDPAQPHSNARPGVCPVVRQPAHQSTLDFSIHTGSLLLEWTGDLETRYRVEYNIGTGEHHVSGVYQVEGNHQILGPFSEELWRNLRAWNPFKIRVSPDSDEPCWSAWVEFRF